MEHDYTKHHRPTRICSVKSIGKLNIFKDICCNDETYKKIPLRRRFENEKALINSVAHTADKVLQCTVFASYSRNVRGGGRYLSRSP